MSTQVISTMNRPTTLLLVFSWACRVVAAVILLQTLFFKFTAAPESVPAWLLRWGQEHQGRRAGTDATSRRRQARPSPDTDPSL